jgi:thiol-disulfide isomerase/thioredoxin
MSSEYSSDSGSSTISGLSSSDLKAIRNLLEKRHTANSTEPSCMNWVVPLLVAIGVGLLVYMLYNYSYCHRQKHDGKLNSNSNSNDNGNDNGNEVLIISNMTNNNNSDGSVIDKTGDQIMEISKKQPIIVAFVAQGCIHCTNLHSPLSEAAKKVKPIQVYTVHAHSAGGMDTCKKHNIIGFPTICLIYKGEVLKEYKGQRKPDDIANWIKSVYKQII